MYVEYETESWEPMREWNKEVNTRPPTESQLGAVVSHHCSDMLCSSSVVLCDSRSGCCNVTHALERPTQPVMDEHKARVEL